MRRSSEFERLRKVLSSVDSSTREIVRTASHSKHGFGIFHAYDISFVTERVGERDFVFPRDESKRLVSDLKNLLKHNILSQATVEVARGHLDTETIDLQELNHEDLESITSLSISLNPKLRKVVRNILSKI